MSRPSKEKIHLFEERKSVIYLLDYRGFNGEEIGTIVGLSRSVISRILSSKPKEWKQK